MCIEQAAVFYFKHWLVIIFPSKSYEYEHNTGIDIF